MAETKADIRDVLVVHTLLRQMLDKLIGATERLDPAEAASIIPSRWGLYVRGLHHHHESEDHDFFPVIVAVQLVFTLGLALLLSALTVHFRDIRDLLANLLTFWFFATPIIYFYKMKTVAAFSWFFNLNPFFHLAVSYQEVLFFYRSADDPAPPFGPGPWLGRFGGGFSMTPGCSTGSAFAVTTGATI